MNYLPLPLSFLVKVSGFSKGLVACRGILRPALLEKHAADFRKIKVKKKKSLKFLVFPRWDFHFFFVFL
jgi:hypothetical protein